MVCPSCGTVFEGRFCPRCGTDTQRPASLNEPAAPVPFVPPPPAYVPPYAYLCVRCGATFAGPWCPYCGTPVGGPIPGAGARAVGSVFWAFSMVAFLALLVANLAALVYASGLVISGAFAGGPRPIWLFVLTPFPWGPLIDASAEVFVGYFALILAAIVAAYAWYAVRDAKPTAQAFTRPLGELRARLESRSAWVATGQVFLAAFFFQFVYILVLAVAGFDPSAPTSGGGIPDWYQYFALANASVYEEIVTRFLFIGVPLAIAALVVGARASAPGAAPVPAWRHLLGGTLTRNSPRGMVSLAAVLVFVSSVIFGLAHVPGWGLWKFLPSMVAGLGMGYLFVRRGLLAGILFHFATDYLGALAILSGDNLGAQIVLGLFILLLVGLGVFFFVWYVVYAAELWSHLLGAWGLRRPQPAVSAPAPLAWGDQVALGRATRAVWPAYPLGQALRPPPVSFAPPPGSPYRSSDSNVGPSPAIPPYGGGWAPFVCPRCGWMEARFDAGRFTCLRCGQVA